MECGVEGFVEVVKEGRGVVVVMRVGGRSRWSVGEC